MRISSTSARSRALPAALITLAALYVIQLASPLRLDTDSVSYLQMRHRSPTRKRDAPV